MPVPGSVALLAVATLTLFPGRRVVWRAGLRVQGKPVRPDYVIATPVSRVCGQISVTVAQRAVHLKWVGGPRRAQGALVRVLAVVAHSVDGSG
jgi:hypothetical protein